MKTKEELIIKYEIYKSACKHIEDDDKTVNSIYNRVMDKELRIYNEFIEDLKNLPNELQGVSNNEQTKEICYKTGKECKYDCKGLCKDSC